MNISVHSGFGQSGPHLTIESYWDEADPRPCKITRYRFRNWEGAEIEIVHFEHISDEDLAYSWGAPEPKL